MLSESTLIMGESNIVLTRIGTAIAMTSEKVREADPFSPQIQVLAGHYEAVGLSFRGGVTHKQCQKGG